MKKILTMSVREMYAMLLIISMLLFSLIYTSMALFEKTVEKVGIASIVASEINFVLTSDESDFIINGNSGAITVLAGETKTFDIMVTNNMNNSVRYKMYYRFENDITILDVNVGISSNSDAQTSDLIGVNESKIVKVVVENNSTQSATIEIGAQGGYAGNNVVALNNGRNEMEIISESKTLVSLILGENNSNVITDEPIFTSESIDRGLFVQQGDDTKSTNGLPTYYFRGSSTSDTINPDYKMNNYVKFGTYQTTDGGNTIGDPIIWRVVRINEDGSIRLINENVVSSEVAWNSGGIANYVNAAENEDYTIKDIVEEWYINNIGNNTILDNKVVSSSFCNDVSSNYESPSTRLSIDTPNPIFICPAEAIVVNEKVGLITADEMVYSGGLISNSNSNNNTYLNNNSNFWTLTPSSSSSALYWNSSDKYMNSISVNDIDTVLVRAVINLSSNVKVSDGDGLSADTAYEINLD